MARRAKVTEEVAAESTEATPKAPAVRRRRRRTTVDYAAQTQILVSALLKTRSESGANQADLLTAVSWARGVHTEGAELKTLATRVRKARGEGVAERQLAYDVNKALLESVLTGTCTLDVRDGQLCFVESPTRVGNG